MNIKNRLYHRKLSEDNAYGDWAILAPYLIRVHKVALNVLNEKLEKKFEACYLTEEINRENLKVNQSMISFVFLPLRLKDIENNGD